MADPAIPVCRRPALLGRWPPPGPPRQADLDTGSNAGGSGRWSARLARADGGRDGLPQPPTPPASADGPPTILEPERPRRRRSIRNPATRPPARRRGRRALPYAARARGRAARPAAGPTPIHHWSVVPRRPLGLPASAPAAGVLRGRSRSASGATDARPGGGACGPFRAALKTYRNFAPHPPAAGCPVSGPA